MSANPGHEDTALKYLNEGLLPFARTHKAQYVCLVSEVFYNSQSSTDELKGFADAKHSSGAVPIAFIEFAYFLIKTEPTREHLGLQVSRLLRIGYGPFNLGDLPRGATAEIPQVQVERLRRGLKT